MEQLLQIKTIPIKIEVTVNRAKLDYNNPLPKVAITKDKGKMTMHAEPIKINVDSQKMFDSIGLKKIDTLSKEASDKGFKVAYEATAKIVQDGNKLEAAHKFSPADIAAEQSQRSIESVLAFIPKDGPEISWSDGTLSIQYQADQLNFDWDIKPKAGFEFVPGNIQFNIKEYPRVDIEYVGGPIYVPPSADPNYVEPVMNLKV